jgi:hypothetical protein
VHAGRPADVDDEGRPAIEAVREVVEVTTDAAETVAEVAVDAAGTVAEVTSHAAETAETHTAVSLGARVGFALDGVLHVAMGWAGLRIAWGAYGSTADESGALTSISHTLGGRASLWVGVVGFSVVALWNIARAITFIKPAMAIAEIPVHVNCGMGVGGVPNCVYPPADATSRASKAFVEILRIDGF